MQYNSLEKINVITMAYIQYFFVKKVLKPVNSHISMLKDKKNCYQASNFYIRLHVLIAIGL